MNIGDIIDGKYRILRPIGQGGMGVVYEVQHQIVGQKYALKCLNNEQALDQERLTRFVQEAQAAAAIGSEHIVYITDAGRTADGAPFLVMELLQGRDLRDVIQQEAPLQVERAIDLVLQVCDALEAAHGQGIVHRDIKPGNLFVTEHKRFGEKVKVLDFGVAKVREPGAPDDPQLTTTGAPLGTPFYMAQEQFVDAKGVDQRADIYSVGMILFELLTGQRPYGADNYTALVIEVATGTPHRMTDFVQSLNPALDDIVLRAIARLPEERFQSITDLADALEPYAGRASVDQVRMTPPQQPPQGTGTAVPVQPTMPLQQPQSASGADLPIGDTPTTFPGDPNAGEEPPTPTVVSFTSAPSRKRSRWPLFVLAGGGLLVVLMAFAGIGTSFYLSQQPEPPGGEGAPPTAAATTNVAPLRPAPPAAPPAPSPAPEPPPATTPVENPDAAVASNEPPATTAPERDAGAAARRDAAPTAAAATASTTPATPIAPATPSDRRPTPGPTQSSRHDDIQRPASRPRHTPAPSRPAYGGYGRELDHTRPNYGSEL